MIKVTSYYWSSYFCFNIYGFTIMTEALILNLLVGLVIGYTLIRGDFGFAGSLNRAYRFGSTKLTRMLMFMFVILGQL